jgi:hypothetical protein
MHMIFKCPGFVSKSIPTFRVQQLRQNWPIRYEQRTCKLVSRRRDDSGSVALPEPSRKAVLWGMTWPTCCASDEP